MFLVAKKKYCATVEFPRCSEIQQQKQMCAV